MRETQKVTQKEANMTPAQKQDGIVIETPNGPRFISTKQIVDKMRFDFEDRNEIAGEDDYDFPDEVESL